MKGSWRKGKGFGVRNGWDWVGWMMIEELLYKVICSLWIFGGGGGSCGKGWWDFYWVMMIVVCFWFDFSNLVVCLWLIDD